MADNKYQAFIDEHRGELEKLRKAKNAALSDDEMASATGGVGGAHEATCPQCGQPMEYVDHEFGDNFWTCSSCNMIQYFSDAEYIEVVREIEKAGGSNQIVYPVWWSQVNK